MSRSVKGFHPSMSIEGGLGWESRKSRLRTIRACMEDAKEDANLQRRKLIRSFKKEETCDD
jgi:hypothetical protein